MAACRRCSSPSPSAPSSKGAAGFGAPVAVAGAMLAGLGFNPFYAAGICLLANTAPVAFGSIGIPVITLANVTGLPLPALERDGRAVSARSSPSSSPRYLLVVMAGRKRALEVLPAIIGVRRLVRRHAVPGVELHRRRAHRHRLRR
ncbi:MAG: L-lactate permease [Vicinamibacterales bacterium]